MYLSWRPRKLNVCALYMDARYSRMLSYKNIVWIWSIFWSYQNHDWSRSHEILYCNIADKPLTCHIFFDRTETTTDIFLITQLFRFFLASYIFLRLKIKQYIKLSYTKTKNKYQANIREEHRRTRCLFIFCLLLRRSNRCSKLSVFCQPCLSPVLCIASRLYEKAGNMVFKLPRLLISLLAIKLYISLYNSVIFLELALFDISIKDKRGAQKNQAFVDFFYIVNEAEPRR